MAVTVVPCPCGTGTEPPPTFDCDPVPMCARTRGLTGPEVWALPAGVESFAIDIICGPITVTDCTGEATVINECGSLQYSAPALGCTPGVFCTPFTVTIPADSQAYIRYVMPCEGVV